MAQQAVLSFWPTWAGTLTFVAFIHQDSPPSFSLEEWPQNKEAPSTSTKKSQTAFFFSPFQNSVPNCSVQLSTFLQLTLLQERKMWNWLHTCTHKTQAKLHCTGGSLGSVSGSQPQGYNGKAKNDRTCGLLNILFDFPTSCQWQCPAKEKNHKFLNKSMAQPDMDQTHLVTLEFFS